MKKLFLKLIPMTLLLTLVLGMTACGGKDSNNAGTGSNAIANQDAVSSATGNQDVISDTAESGEAASNASTAEENADDTSGFSFRASMPDEEIVMTIDGVELPLTTTWDEFVAIAAENGWTYDEELSKEKYAKDVITSNGSFSLTFMNNPTTNINEIWNVYVTSNEVPENYINIHGITAKTSRDVLATLLEVNVREKYIDSYYFNEYTTITFSWGRDTTDNPDISIDRTLFSKR